MAANPGLTVTVTDVPFANLFTNFETQAGAGSGPDLYIAPNDNLPKEARAGLLKDVSSLVPILTAAPYNTSQVAIDASTVDGKLYEIPESMKAVELFYNNTVITTAPATIDDWLANAKQLGWVYGANGGGAYYLWGLYSSFGGTIMDATTGKCTADQGGVADALKWLAQMKTAGMKFYQNDGDAKADLLSGKIAGFIDGPWQSGDLSKALGAKLSVTAGPNSAERQLGAAHRAGRLLHQRQLAERRSGGPVRAPDAAARQRAALRERRPPAGEHHPPAE